MQNSPIRLGSIDLQDFEIPQSVRFGGRHRLAVHTLAGGKRLIERLGPDDDEIKFQGIFSGQTAEARARAFDNLRLSGEIIWLTWESFRRRVIVKHFVADYHSPWWIRYQVSCIVVHQIQVTASQAPGLAAVVSADVSAALSAAAGSSISLTSLQAALVTANAYTIGTADQASAVAAVGSVLDAIDSQMDQQSAALIEPIAATTAPSDMGNSYRSKVGSAASLATSVNVRPYVARIGINVKGTLN